MAERVTTQPASRTAKFFKYWLPVFLLLAAMYLFSTDLFAADTTRQFIRWLLSFIGRGSDADAAAGGNLVLRKVGHFAGYALLAALVFRALRAGQPDRFRMSWALGAYFFTLAWACFDEFHQTRTRLRSGSGWDVLLDMAGAATALLLIAFSAAQRRKG